jgi:pilus assembly protein Flp/PilA
VTTSARAGKEVNLVHPKQRLLAIIDRFRSDENGQGLAEYALIIALIAIIAIVALLFMGGQLSDKFHVIGTTLESVQ